jgi:hypothetical protein
MATKCYECDKEITKGRSAYRATYSKGYKKVAYCRDCWVSIKGYSDAQWRGAFHREPKTKNGLPIFIH